MHRMCRTALSSYIANCCCYFFSTAVKVEIDNDTSNKTCTIRIGRYTNPANIGPMTIAHGECHEVLTANVS